MSTLDPIPDAHRRIRAALDWLCRSQDAAEGGGSSAYYAPILGWAAPYPETTGYIIPTLWRGGDFLGDDRYGRRALKMAQWLLELQAEDGWFPGGTVKPRATFSPSIFNTGQILFGLVEAAQRTHDDRFAEAASRAAKWLVAQQDDDGRWTAHAYVDGYSPSYYSHVCWPLLEYWRVYRESEVRRCAERGLEAVLSDRSTCGTFSRWGFASGKPAFTHTIGYTLQGLVESAEITGMWHPFGSAASETCGTLLRKYEVKHQLAGTYDDQWNGCYRFQCLTGNCQLALTWLRIYEHDRDPRFLNVAVKAILEACRYQALQRGPRNLRGAIPGSAPLYGPYMRFRYPNWAAKFFVDAMIAACRLLEAHEDREAVGESREGVESVAPGPYSTTNASRLSRI